MVLGDGPEGFSGKRQIHRVPRLVGKVDGKSCKHRVHRFDVSETPASMHAKAAIGQLHQRLDMLALQFPGGSHFLEFFSHKYLNARVPKGERAIKQCERGKTKNNCTS